MISLTYRHAYEKLVRIQEMNFDQLRQPPLWSLKRRLRGSALPLKLAVISHFAFSEGFSNHFLLGTSPVDGGTPRNTATQKFSNRRTNSKEPANGAND